LSAPALPVFSWRTSRTRWSVRATCRTRAAVSSVEPSSTTRISVTGYSEARSESKVRTITGLLVVRRQQHSHRRQTPRQLFVGLREPRTPPALTLTASTTLRPETQKTAKDREQEQPVDCRPQPTRRPR
jgi:hypothetical protein